jgi:hypothetical protein
MLSNQCCGSVKFFTDPDADPDPAIFISDFKGNKKKKFFLLITYFLKVHLYHFSQIKSRKTVGINVFLLFVLDDRRIRESYPYL